WACPWVDAGPRGPGCPVLELTQKAPAGSASRARPARSASRELRVLPGVSYRYTDFSSPHVPIFAPVVPPPQCSPPDLPLLKSSRVEVRALLEPGDRNPVPTGGQTRPPIRASAAAIAARMVGVDAPAATLSLAAISWCMSVSSPLPAAGVLKMLISWASE